MAMCEVLDKVENRGIQKGIEQGIEQDRREILFNMQSKGLSAEEIADYTGLSILEVRKVLS